VVKDRGLDLLNGLLTFDPEKRVTATRALQHRWFSEPPAPQVEQFCQRWEYMWVVRVPRKESLGEIRHHQKIVDKWIKVKVDEEKVERYSTFCIEFLYEWSGLL